MQPHQQRVSSFPQGPIVGGAVSFSCIWACSVCCLSLSSQQRVSSFSQGCAPHTVCGENNTLATIPTSKPTDRRFLPLVALIFIHVQEMTPPSSPARAKKKKHLQRVSTIELYSAFVFIIVLAWHILPSAFAFFYSAANKHTRNTDDKSFLKFSFLVFHHTEIHI
jgi:hypothetical protein